MCTHVCVIVHHCAVCPGVTRHSVASETSSDYALPPDDDDVPRHTDGSDTSEPEHKLLKCTHVAGLKKVILLLRKKNVCVVNLCAHVITVVCRMLSTDSSSIFLVRLRHCCGSLIVPNHNCDAGLLHNCVNNLFNWMAGNVFPMSVQ